MCVWGGGGSTRLLVRAHTRAWLYSAAHPPTCVSGAPATVAAAIAAAGQDAQSVLRAADAAPIKERLKQATAEAQALGMLGAPSFVVRGEEGAAPEMFFGNDRLVQAFEWARSGKLTTSATYGAESIRPRL